MNSCRKGKRGELAFSKVLQSHGLRAWRGAQHAGKGKGGETAPDICCPDLPIHFEVKNTQRLDLSKSMKQAIADCNEGDLPVVASKKNREGWYLTMRADDFIPIAKAYFGL